MHCMPVGNLEITAAYPLRLGTSLDPFLSLLNVKRLFPEQRVLTTSDELENALARLTDYIENLLQNKFKGEIKSRSAYNEANSSNPLPYKLLLLFDILEQVTDRSLWYLGRILEHGPVCVSSIDVTKKFLYKKSLLKKGVVTNFGTNYRIY